MHPEMSYVSPQLIARPIKFDGFPPDKDHSPVAIIGIKIVHPQGVTPNYPRVMPVEASELMELRTIAGYGEFTPDELQRVADAMGFVVRSLQEAGEEDLARSIQKVPVSPIHTSDGLPDVHSATDTTEHWRPALLSREILSEYFGTALSLVYSALGSIRRSTNAADFLDMVRFDVAVTDETLLILDHMLDFVSSSNFNGLATDRSVWLAQLEDLKTEWKLAQATKRAMKDGCLPIIEIIGTRHLTEGADRYLGTDLCLTLTGFMQESRAIADLLRQETWCKIATLDRLVAFHNKVIEHGQREPLASNFPLFVTAARTRADAIVALDRAYAEFDELRRR